MGWLALVAGLLGFAAVYFSGWSIPIGYGQYVSLAALAGMDSLIGGLRAGAEGKFKSNVFVSGFLVNTLLAVFLSYLGERLGQNLALAAVVTLGYRIFVNLSIIRRHLLDTWDETHRPASGGPNGTGGSIRMVGPMTTPAEP
jgi:small basic protein